VAQRFLAKPLNLFEQLVHATVVRLPLLALLQPLLGGALGKPALDEITLLTLGQGGRRRFVLFETRVTLGEIVAEQRLFLRMFEVHQFLRTRSKDENRQQDQEWL